MARAIVQAIGSRPPVDLLILQSQAPKVNIRFFTAVLLQLLALRALVDRIELGSIVAVLLLGLFLVKLLTLKKISKTILVFGAAYFTLIAWGYGNAVSIHGLPFYSLRGVIRYFSYFAVMFIAYYARPRISIIFSVYGFVLVVQFMVSLVQKLILGFEGRPPGTLVNSNHISYLLVPYFAISLFYYRSYYRAILTFLFSLYLGGLGGFVAILVVGSGFVLTQTKKRAKVVCLLLIPILFALAFAFLDDRIEEQSDIASIENRIEAERPGGGGSFVWRVVTWKLMLDELDEKQGFYTGQGIEYASNSSPYFLSASIREPHNDYLRMLLEFGIFGLAAYLLIYWSAMRRFMSDGKKYNSAVSTALGWTLLALGIGQIVGNIVSQSTLWWFFFAFAGTHLSRIKDMKRQTRR